MLKKFILRAGLDFVLIGFIFTVSGIVASNAYAANEAKILFIAGNVEIKRNLSSTWSLAKRGEILNEGSLIRTQHGSSCELLLGDRMSSAVKLTEDSQAALTSLNPVKINLQQGNILSMVRDLKKGSDFKVISPTAVGAARGTGWAQSLVAIDVFEGKVAVTGLKGQELVLNTKQGVKITQDGVLSGASDVDKGAMDGWTEFKNVVEGYKKTLAQINDAGATSSALSKIEQEANEAVSETSLQNSLYKIVSVKAKKAEDLTYYYIPTKKADIIYADQELMGNDCIVCAKGSTGFSVKPTKSSDSEIKMIDGPISGLLSEVYHDASRVSRKKYAETVVAVQEGAVQTSIIMHVGGKEVIVSSNIIKADSRANENYDAGNPGAKLSKKNLKDRLKNEKESNEESDAGIKKDPNVVIIDPCGYVKAVYVPNLDLTVYCAEEINSDFKQKSASLSSKKEGCAGKGPEVKPQPSLDPIY